ncbi:head maturation protease, ClpP-related [Lactococcus lactis]|uniref:ATP-dependent Clp protease proteolytic subunit n=1 Tax=Lactococcus lactis TaxID=1358 RepID=A0AAP4DU88_9LACT|nr:head maturation protease, ClpP-related [Lactococcus lactis]MDG4976384.1 ATP-dependent Clp protease proteolytic subunit [Lactococcus lactis]
MIKLRLSGVVGWDITADGVSTFLNENADKDITIFLNSPGGSVVDGLEIYNLLRASGRNITTVLTGIAASMGSIIFLAGDKRIAMTGGLFMIHKPSGFTWGDADDFRKEAELLDKMQGSLQEIYQERASIDNLEEAMNAETWFNIEEMKEKGIVTSDELVSFEEVIDPDNGQEDLENEETMAITEEMKAQMEKLKAENAELKEKQEEAEFKEEMAALEASNAQLRAEATEPDPEPSAKAKTINTKKAVAKNTKNKIPAFMQMDSKY